jgi:hypothetical protein
VTDPGNPDDLTVTDDLVQNTDNGPQPDDPDDQPSQNPDDLPDGTATGDA